jgi:hypothetical protein
MERTDFERPVTPQWWQVARDVSKLCTDEYVSLGQLLHLPDGVFSYSTSPFLTAQTAA